MLDLHPTYRFVIGLFFVLLSQACLLLTAAALQSTTSDEYGHFYAGLAYAKDGDTVIFNVNPPLVRGLAVLPSVHEEWRYEKVAWTPSGRPEFDGGRKLFTTHPFMFPRALWLGRILVANFALVGTLIIGVWSRQISGDIGGVVAAAFWAFQPQIIAHGALITNDVAVSASMILAAWCFRNWLKSPTWVGACGVSLTLAIATLCKFTALILWPIFGVFCVSSTVRSPNRVLWIQSLAGAVLAIFIISIPYRFEGIGQPISELSLMSSQFSSYAYGINLHNGFAGHVPCPLPEQLVLGLDRQQLDFETGLPSYAMGTRSQHGWWWFYLYAMGVKLPVGTLLAIVITIAYWVRSIEDVRLDHALLSVVMIAIIQLTAIKSGFAQQHRYIFPAYPFLFVLLATPLANNGHRRWPGKFLIGCLALSVAGTIWASPNWMGAFNLLSGGTDNGHYHLFNDATDWGQDRDRVVEWIVEHPECRPLVLRSNRGFKGISRRASGLPDDLGTIDETLSAWYVISKTDMMLSSYLFKTFFDRPPDYRIGTTHLVYLVEPTTAD